MKSKICLLLFVMFSTSLLAQERTDTIRAAKKVSYKKLPDVTGGYTILKDEASRVISPLGEGDPLKFVQRLSGVSTGSEGSSAVYVRGGGAGNTVITLDGVPIFGQTHMLGLTTVVPQDVITDVQFIKDGYGNGLSGYTGAQINLSTKDGIETRERIGINLTAFLPGVTYNTPIRKGKSSLLMTARWSPLSQEFSLAKSLFKKNGLGVDSLKTAIFDVYGKYNLRISDSFSFYVSGFYTKDGYDYFTASKSRQNLKWSNALGQVRLVRKEDDYDWEVSAYYNSFKSGQKKTAYTNNTYNFLSAESTVSDYGLSFMYHWYKNGDRKVNGGLTVNYTVYRPGTNKGLSDKFLSSGKGDLSAKKLSAFVQMVYNFLDGQATASGSVRGTLYKLGSIRFAPEFYLSGRYYFLPELFADVSVSRTAQFVHILEGMPLGWSTDLIVPSDEDVAPESAVQVSPGLFFVASKNTFYLGAYYKSMDKLLYYTDATSLFGARRSVWKDFIDVGTGKSAGVEMEYTYESERLMVKGAYTLSKTDRTFPSLNDGVSFPAKYDRRHMLNISSEWSATPKKLFLTAAFTLQSGHWDTAKADQYGVPMLESITLESADFLVDYCSGVHNYRHPMYVRMDIGCRYEFGTDAVRHTLSIGVFNVLNRHNPFSIYYDTDDSRWKRLSLIPVLPNFSYKVQF